MRQCQICLWQKWSSFVVQCSDEKLSYGKTSNDRPRERNDELCSLPSISARGFFYFIVWHKNKNPYYWVCIVGRWCTHAEFIEDENGVRYAPLDQTLCRLALPSVYTNTLLFVSREMRIYIECHVRTTDGNSDRYCIKG